MDLFKQFDAYTVRARLYPAALTLLPVLATTLAWFPGLLTSNAGAAVLTIINACGLLTLLAELTRSQGQHVQKKLFSAWGGSPTTQILRHGDATLSNQVKSRYHQYLSDKLGKTMPSLEEEARDAAAADAAYDSAILWLKEQCRGPSFAMLQSENVSYGFRRNLLGLKPTAICVCLATALWPLVQTATHYPWSDGLRASRMLEALQEMEPVQFGALALSLITLSGWLFIIRDRWVREAADLYAIRLLAACDLSAR